ncbi:MAG: hypothetical protein EBZ34_02195 [Flavobacteriia bacterium]|nr:hypothetical protein [Flavobacteriia bacterium]
MSHTDIHGPSVLHMDGGKSKRRMELVAIISPIKGLNAPSVTDPMKTPARSSWMLELEPHAP